MSALTAHSTSIWLFIVFAVLTRPPGARAQIGNAGELCIDATEHLALNNGVDHAKDTLIHAIKEEIERGTALTRAAQAGLIFSPDRPGVFLGSVSGTGAFPGTQTVFLAGELRPGHSPGLVEFAGDVVLGSFSILEIEIGGPAPGTQHDKLQVGQTAYLDGTLQLVLINGYVPPPGTSFEIIRASQVVGTFNNVTVPSAPALPWGVKYEPNYVRVFVAVPPDLDVDNDVDDDDLALLNSCQTRDRVPHDSTPLCQTADLDDDGDVDPNDFGRFQRCFSGANNPPPAGCAG